MLASVDAIFKLIYLFAYLVAKTLSRDQAVID